MVAQSVTNQEIARYWKQRHLLEEDHLFAAIKAAARLRARNLSEDEYLQFQDSLREEEEDEKNSCKLFREKANYKNKAERRVGVNDWWTKSKYAYLNQPAAVKSVDHRRRRSDFQLLQYSISCKSALKFNPTYLHHLN